MSKVVVYHSDYGCDTGCCGHVIKFDDRERFTFGHPFREGHREWAERVVRRELGDEHVADLDWDNCDIVDIVEE